MEMLRNWLTGPTKVAAVTTATSSGFPAGKVMFRAQPFWQELRKDHIAAAGIEFRMGMDDGVNYAKLKTGVEVEPDSEFAKAAVKVVSTGKGDTVCLSALLREAAAADDTQLLEKLFQSCYVTVDAASAALCEAARNNNAASLSLLLGAGCCPASSLSVKPALHFAAENGAEECSRLLIDALSRERVHAVDPRTNKTAFEAAIDADLTPLSNRLMAYASEQGKGPLAGQRAE